MYTNDDLKFAVDQKIFTAENVDIFKEKISEKNNKREVRVVDEENFKLVKSLNDIFVVMASSLLLFSLFWFTGVTLLSYVLFIVLSWLLSELFVRQKKMALPGIVLLAYFVGGVFFGVADFFSFESSNMLWAFLAGVIASLLHWKRFHVPITVAAAAVTLLGFLASLLMRFFDIKIFDIHEYLWIFTLFTGGLVFVFAMYWDSGDKKRETYKSDVAFWLHLVAAPLIVHSAFSQIIDFSYGAESNDSMIFIALFMYLLLTVLSLVVNRRIFMISSLFYVLYALSQLLSEYGAVDSYESLAGIIMGVLLLGVSVYWHETRAMVLQFLPNKILAYVPYSQEKV